MAVHGGEKTIIHTLNNYGWPGGIFLEAALLALLVTFSFLLLLLFFNSGGCTFLS